MSGPEKPLGRAAHPQSKRKPLSAEDQEAMDEMDDVFKRIKKNIPKAPYILSTPSLEPYRHYSRHEAQTFMMGRLFEPHEEHLQYRTFVYREPYQDCFTLQNGEDDEPDVERPRSQASETPHQGPKKKISLSAYRSQQANGIITPGPKKTSPSLPPTRPPPAQTNGVKASERPQSSTPTPRQKVDEVKIQKRPAPEPLVREKAQKRACEEPPCAPTHPPQEKPDIAESKMNIDPSGPSNSTPHGLPPLLSPVDQALNNPYGLPAILSPTLPSNVQAELDRLETKRQRAESNASTSSSDRKSQLLSVPESRPEDRVEGAKSSSKAPSASLSRKSPSAVSSKQAENSEPSLVVKLKFSKARRADVSRILKLRPGSLEKKDSHEAPKESLAKVTIKAVDGPLPKLKEGPRITPRRPDPTPGTKATSGATKLSEKRLRTEDDSAPAMSVKRPKMQVSQDGSKTPTRQVISSPPRSTKSSAQKSNTLHVTPRKDHKINMLRTNSTEGFDSTPGRSGITPTASNHHDIKSIPTSTPISGKKQTEFALLSQTSMRLNKMGRSLKHDAQKVLMEKGSKATKEDERRAAVTGLECILSYMAAYHAQDLSMNLRSRPVEVEQTWKTLLPLCGSYARATKDFPHLDGLRCYLSAAISAAICMHVAPRATRPPDSHSTPHVELMKQRNALAESFNLLSDNYLKLLRFTQDARVALPIDDIQKLYPKTWASREMNPKLVRDPEPTSSAKLSGPYFLPIQNDTTPIQAVRFGLKFIHEYCERERLAYNIRVNLDRSE